MFENWMYWFKGPLNSNNGESSVSGSKWLENIPDKPESLATIIGLAEMFTTAFVEEYEYLENGPLHESEYPSEKELDDTYGEFTDGAHTRRNKQAQTIKTIISELEGYMQDDRLTPNQKGELRILHKRFIADFPMKFPWDVEWSPFKPDWYKWNNVESALLHDLCLLALNVEPDTYNNRLDKISFAKSSMELVDDERINSDTRRHLRISTEKELETLEIPAVTQLESNKYRLLQIAEKNISDHGGPIEVVAYRELYELKLPIVKIQTFVMWMLKREFFIPEEFKQLVGEQPAFEEVHLLTPTDKSPGLFAAAVIDAFIMDKGKDISGIGAAAVKRWACNKTIGEYKNIHLNTTQKLTYAKGHNTVTDQVINTRLRERKAKSET